MKILAAGDMHNHKEIAEGIIRELKKVNYDLFIGLGDYTKKEYFENLMKKIKTQKLCLTGNWDLDFKLPENNEIPNLFNYVKANFKAKDGDYKIIMLGAVFPSDFKKDILTWINDFKREKIIVCSHYPPYLLRDFAESGTHAGIPEFRELILRLKPSLWLCGHIHEAAGQTKFLRTTILNVSACDVKYNPIRIGYSIELDENGVKEIKEIKLKSKEKNKSG